MKIKNIFSISLLFISLVCLNSMLMGTMDKITVVTEASEEEKKQILEGHKPLKGLELYDKDKKLTYVLKQKNCIYLVFQEDNIDKHEKRLIMVDIRQTKKVLGLLAQDLKTQTTKLHVIILTTNEESNFLEEYNLLKILDVKKANYVIAKNFLLLHNALAKKKQQQEDATDRTKYLQDNLENLGIKFSVKLGNLEKNNTLEVSKAFM